MRRGLAVLLLGLVAMLSVNVMPAGASDIAAPAESLSTTTPIKHFVALMQENHSFDNYFGSYPGADGVPSGTCMPDLSAGRKTCVKPFHVGGKSVVDLGHNQGIFQAEVNSGKMNGFVSAFDSQMGVGNLAMGYYDARDLPYYWNIANNYVLFDRLFTSAAGGSVWNHMFWLTGTPGNPKSDALLAGGFDAVPTILDRLQHLECPGSSTSRTISQTSRSARQVPGTRGHRSCGFRHWTTTAFLMTPRCTATLWT